MRGQSEMRVYNCRRACLLRISLETNIGATRPTRARNMLAVCLTGEMRWPELTLAAVNEMILRRIPTDRRRTYHVGPSDPTTSAATELLLRRLGIVSAHDSCPYHPTISWEWGPADINGEPTTPFDATFNGRSPCTSVT